MTGEIVRFAPTPRLYAPVAIALGILVAIAFGGTLNSYFLLDDYWHINDLYRLFNGEPDGFLKSLTGPWAGRDSVYLFYRPFTEASLALDYLLFRGSAAGFHMTNLILHWLNSLLVFHLSRMAVLSFLAGDDHHGVYPVAIPLIVAALFAVHPANTEVVVWVLARADLVGLACYLLALSFFFERLAKGSRLAHLLSIVFLALGLLSKETCITIPVVATLLAWLLSKEKSQGSRIQQAIGETRYFWLTAITYLLIRSLALGTVVGGYVGSIGGALNQTILERFTVPLGLWMLAFPLSLDVFADESWLELLLRCCYLVIAALILANVVATRCVERRARFLIGALLIAAILLAINLQVWTINRLMIGSRIAYFLLVPLLMGLSSVVLPLRCKSRLEKGMASVALLVALLLVSLFLYISNQTSLNWDRSTKEMKTLKSSIVDALGSTAADRKLVLVELPQLSNGLVSMFNTDYLEGMLQPPLTDRDLSGRVACIDGSPIFSIFLNSSLIEMLAADRERFRLMTGSGAEFGALHDFKLHPVPTDPDFEKVLSSERLGSFGRIRSRTLPDSGHTYRNETKGNDIVSYRVVVDEPLGMPESRLLQLRIECGERRLPAQKEPRAEISWPAGRYRLRHYDRPLAFKLSGSEKTNDYSVFPGQFKSWPHGMKSVPIRVDLPAGYQLQSVRMKATCHLVPRLTTGETLALGSNGLLRLTGDGIKLNYDVRHIAEAHSTRLEVSRPFVQFEYATGTLRDARPSRLVSLERVIDGVSGELVVERAELPRPGYYQVRVAALDSNGAVTGCFSDPLTIDTTLAPAKSK